ncbi:MAG: maltose alpha-D-glucosyltransferase [Rhodocyclaceae bacterium]|nr:maltose alpha-D-glucosyltransferase [Rhodocyclaceae bacterium]
MPDQREVSTLPEAAESAGKRRNDHHLWYKDAVVYELHVKGFFDSNGDGIGDFRGLIRKLDYLQELGVTALWLLPFYPSPMKDDGYDIADYRNIHSDYGTRGDFRQFVREAHRRGLKVITELVINHTSDQHPWFQAARRAPPGSGKHNFYVWSPTPTRYAGTRIIFTDTESSNWARDEIADAYYWHRFFSHQPDLNFDNPTVLKAVLRVMRFWLDMGVDGLRLDAIPYLCEREGTSNENLPETHAIIRQIRAVIDAHYSDRMLLAEANQWPEDVRDYLGDGDECHMAYHFPLMPRMYMAIAQEDRHPIVEIMQQTPDIPDTCHWAIFLRNHDELTLEMVTSRERDYMYQMYGADPRSRLNLGIRRRLAPLMDNDPDRIKLMNFLLLSMPGTPIIYYGDEIGMGDNIYLGDRNGVRTPMQWSPDRNAGFSQADPQRLYLPPIMDPIYGYEAVNVEAQSRDPSSLLNWMRRMLSVRDQYKGFGRGTLSFLRAGNRKVLAFVREYGDQALLCVANLAHSGQPVELDLSRFKGRVPIELLGRAAFPPIGELPYLLTLGGHGFFWFRLAAGEEAPAWHEERVAREEPPMLVLFDGWHSLFRDRVVPWRIAMAENARRQLETEVLPRFVAAQRWYGDGEPPARVALAQHAEWSDGRGDCLVAIYAIELAGGGSQPCFLPLSLVWEDGDDERMRAMAPATAARVRHQARIGILADAFADEWFCRALVSAAQAGKELPCAAGRIRLAATPAFAALAHEPIDALPIRTAAARPGVSAVALGKAIYIKCYRRPPPFPNAETEIGRYLAEVAAFPHSVPIYGTVEYHADDGGGCTLALLQGYVENQGSGLDVTLEYLQRHLEQLRTNAPAAAPPVEPHGAYLALMRTLGRRTAELHRALGQATGDAAFDPEPIAPADVAAWTRAVLEDAEATLAALARRGDSLPAEARAAAGELLARRDEFLRRLETCVAPGVGGAKTRLHGDYHLGRVLLAQNDFVIIDFRPVDAGKQSPLRDAAGMVHSIDGAAKTALARAAADRPDEFAALEEAARHWRDDAEAAFLQAYREAALAAGLFADWEQARGLLALFTLQATLRELRRDLTDHPERTAALVRGMLAPRPMP